MAVEIPGWVESVKRDVQEQIDNAPGGDGNSVTLEVGQAEAAAIVLALEVLDRIKEQREIREENVRHISEQIVDGQGFNEMSQGVLERFGRDLSMIRVLLEGK
jgi:hypothetical protein